MNHLARVDEERYFLPRHARIVVFDRRERELLTIYDCGVTQKPPSAQLLGNLGRIDVSHVHERSVTGYTVSLREAAILEHLGADHYRIIPRGD